MASAKGMRVEVQWQSTVPTTQRLEEIRQLMETAREHPKFNAYISQDHDMQTSFEEAFDADFDVYVVATMPDKMNRRLIGKSAALRDEQLDEIARLPQGGGNRISKRLA